MCMDSKNAYFGNIMYASRGPVCDIHDIAVMKQITDGAKELAKKYNAIDFKNRTRRFEK